MKGLSPRHRLLGIMILLLTMALVLSACGGSEAVPAQEAVAEAPEESVQEPQVQEEVAEAPTQAQAPTAVPAPTEPAAAEEPASPAFELGYDLGPSSLHASNPSEVSLASGQVQLVEFFAFW